MLVVSESVVPKALFCVNFFRRELSWPSQVLQAFLYQQQSQRSAAEGSGRRLSSTTLFLRVLELAAKLVAGNGYGYGLIF
jgi:hypothetical protein